MPPEIKFCGLTRAADVATAVELGARYVGVIFAQSPRRRTADQARALLASVPPSVQAMGVFGDESLAEILRTADELGLAGVQLHADPTADTVRAARLGFGGAVWAAVRCAGRTLPNGAEALFAEADGVVLDARVPGALGGTGVALEWGGLADAVARVPRRGKLVLAGGLTPENVAMAAATMSPDVVDVSSGVESAPGIKERHRMQAFADAVRSARRQAAAAGGRGMGA